MTIKKFYNPEKGLSEEYVECWIHEKVIVKDIDDLDILSHYWKDKDGILWNDFEHPDENLLSAFSEYRKRKKYTTPEKLRMIQKRLGLSINEFSKRIGLPVYYVLAIENNKLIQSREQEIALRKFIEGVNYDL